MRGATLFSGGGGAEALLRSHINFVHAVEYDAHIAAVYAANIGPHVQVARVEDVDYSLWGALDYLHASPVCKEYSAAKTNGAEGEGDLSSAAAVVRCLEATQPRVFTLENVGAYQHGQAFRLIAQWLNHNGYMWHAEVLNSADFGVPQTRRRLILRAVRDALLPTLPPPVKWVGWYAAIEDLIPELPESQFAPWQLARLPKELTESTFFNNNAGTDDYTTLNRRGALEPASAIVSTPKSTTSYRAFIMGNNDSEWGAPYRTDDQSMLGMTTQTGARARAWLTTGKVVRINTRAMARFQTVPNSYVLPEKASLASTVIGNMVPSLMMKVVVSQLI